MSEKRYFRIEYGEEWYLFDSTTISEQLVKEQAEYGYGVFANSLSPSEIVDLLNELYEENKQLRQERDYWKAKFDEATETFTIDEKLYAQEIRRLNKEAKEVLDFKSLGGDY